MNNESKSLKQNLFQSDRLLLSGKGVGRTPQSLSKGKELIMQQVMGSNRLPGGEIGFSNEGRRIMSLRQAKNQPLPQRKSVLSQLYKNGAPLLNQQSSALRGGNQFLTIQQNQINKQVNGTSNNTLHRSLNGPNPLGGPQFPRSSKQNESKMSPNVTLIRKSDIQNNDAPQGLFANVDRANSRNDELPNVLQKRRVAKHQQNLSLDRSRKTSSPLGLNQPSVREQSAERNTIRQHNSQSLSMQIQPFLAGENPQNYINSRQDGGRSKLSHQGNLSSSRFTPEPQTTIGQLTNVQAKYQSKKTPLNSTQMTSLNNSSTLPVSKTPMEIRTNKVKELLGSRKKLSSDYQINNIVSKQQAERRDSRDSKAGLNRPPSSRKEADPPVQGQGIQGAPVERPQTRDRRSQKSRSVVANPLPALKSATQAESENEMDRQPKYSSLSRPSHGDNQQRIPVKKTTPAQQTSKPSDGIHNVVTKFSFATKGGIAAHNPYKVNQDAYLTNPHILNLRHCHFFSVCDGHGHNGQEVSGLLKHRLPFNIELQLRKALSERKTQLASYPDFKTVNDALTQAFSDTNNEVYQMVSDVRFSGSTCTSILTYGRKLYMANVGDSRSIIIRAKPGSETQCTCEALSRDHKPDDKDEAAVIIAHNGRIDSYRDQLGNQIGPMRVWLKHEDIPGLAMTRSFGDAMAARVGVNAIPEIKTFDLNPDDKCIVLASDGVWEFLENQAVANIVYPFFLQRNAEGAAEALVRASFKRWKKEESVIDDITCIIVFLDVK